jgi:hypothetical protein
MKKTFNDYKKEIAEIKKKEYARIYYQKHKNKILKTAKKWRETNKEKVNKYQREYLKSLKEKNPAAYERRMENKKKYRHKKYWEERMEKPINERVQHLKFSCSGNKYTEKLRKKNLEYLNRKAPELKDKVLSDDELMDYILKNENI